MLLWRIGLGALPTKKMLALKMGNMDTLCQLCGKAEESDVHLFFECHVSKEIWFGCSWSIRIDRLNLSYNEKIGANTARAPELCCWKCLPSGAIKLNIDAAVARDSTSLAVVARDDHGQALQLADSEKFRRIIVEEDVKVCFDALNGDPCNTNWREANEVAHSLAKFVPTSKSSYFSWNVSSLPKAA
uniref:Reverse transcriptase zinc-binding domain-containing protein n=1 Tax=Fagus sylvatica TaxID=28930 RepID=A0A2N9GX56_FAGSY